jgi:multidrug efflux pump
MARRATCRRRSTRRAPTCRPACAANPTYRKVNPADAPILILAMTSDTLTAGELYDAARPCWRRSCRRSNGVGQVSVGGGSLPAIRVP